MLFLIFRFLSVLLCCSLCATYAEESVSLNRYTSISVSSFAGGLEQKVEKYISGPHLSLKELLNEILGGSGISLSEVDDPSLAFRLSQDAPDFSRVQQGTLLSILHRLIGEGYQILYDPIHSLVNFRILPRWKKLIAREKSFCGEGYASF